MFEKVNPCHPDKVADRIAGGQAYREHPALSRLDNETLICPDCGTREALDSIGVKPEEQEQIIASIHRCRQPE